MLVIGVFRHSIELEQALAELENDLVRRDNILVVPMEEGQANLQIGERPHGFEVGIACGTGSAVIGASAGFTLAWGPILWGLIAAFIGFGIGTASCFILNRRRQASRMPNPREVTVMIQCTEEQSSRVRRILRQYQALSVGHLDIGASKQARPPRP